MASSPLPKKFVTLRSSDNEEFSVEESIIMQAQTIQLMIEDDCASDVIPVPNVDARILGKVIEYCTKHADESLSAEELEEFDSKFVDVSVDELYDLIMAGNYLNIASMFDCAAEKAASLMRGKNPAEIREIFNIKNDFTPEEEEEMRKENPWAFGD